MNILASGHSMQVVTQSQVEKQGSVKQIEIVVKVGFDVFVGWHLDHGHGLVADGKGRGSFLFVSFQNRSDGADDLEVLWSFHHEFILIHGVAHVDLIFSLFNCLMQEVDCRLHLGTAHGCDGLLVDGYKLAENFLCFNGHGRVCVCFQRSWFYFDSEFDL